MSTARYIEIDNALNPEVIRKFFSWEYDRYKIPGERKLGLFGISLVNKKVATLGDLKSAIILKYPFPPKDCNEALLTLDLLKNDLAAEQNRIAGGGTSKTQYNLGNAALGGLVSLLATKTSGKDIDNTILNTYQQQIKNFQAWITQQNCVQVQQDTANTAFTNQLLNATTAINSPAAAGSGNWIIYVVLGLLVVGGLVIVLKK